MLELEKRNIHRNRLKSQTGTQVTLDDDFIVPDTMDDISEVILDSGLIQLEPVKVQRERITVRGKLEFHVLYRTEEGGLQTLGGAIPFEEGINVPELEEKDYVSVGWQLDDLDTEMIHSRKLGVRAIDGLLTMGKGQRMGIFAGSGVGKSTLMGMIARNVKADVNVIALVGERGREVVEFIDRDLGPEGMARTVLVVATSDQPAMMRSKCALTATAIAEYFRDQGMDVLLMMDSLTRFCMAQREIGLAAGEPPVARGYTPSIYAALPKLLERSGNFGHGSITGIYTVLVEGDDTNEPISDTVRGIVDGHIVLSRKVAMRNHYPAIDILASISRLMSSIVEPAHRLAAGKVRNMMSVYQQNQDLLLIGAYKSGSNPELDQAIRHMDAINRLLQQSVDTKVSFQETVEQLGKIVE